MRKVNIGSHIVVFFLKVWAGSSMTPRTISMVLLGLMPDIMIYNIIYWSNAYIVGKLERGDNCW